MKPSFSRFPRLPLWMLLLATLVVMAPAQVVVAYDGLPTQEEIEALGRRINEIQRSIDANPPAGEAAEPPELADPASPSALLAAVIDGLNQLLARRDIPFKPSSLKHLGRAREALVDAQGRYGLAEDPGEVIASLRRAARSLHPASPSSSQPGFAEVEHLQFQLASAAEGIATQVVDLAGSVGADPRGIAVAQARIDDGRRLVRQGNYVAALAHLGGAASFAANTLISFDFELFQQNIDDSLAGETIGHAYVIAFEGQLFESGAFGDARTSEEMGGQVDQSGTKEMYLASISKTMSALALLKALQAEGISVDDDISPYLPPDWNQDEDVDDITFRHLLTHKSGLDEPAASQAGQNFASMQAVIASGPTGTPGLVSPNYNNANYSLMRIMIPRIALGGAVIDAYVNALPDEEDYVYAAVYEQYVGAEILAPADLGMLPCSPRESQDVRTQYYTFPDPESGIDLGDWTLSCGSTGWYLSAFELAQLMAFVRYTEDVIDEETRDLMDEGFLGWHDPDQFAWVNGEFGPYRQHGGDSTGGSNPGMMGCTMKYPLQVEATLLINSRGGSISGAIGVCSLLRDAYDNAWVPN
jgi:hypothetical protein